MKVSIITPTRNRPQQLSLVIDCINNQTIKPNFWIIVDDGQNPIDQSILNKITIPYRYINYKSVYNPSTGYNSYLCFKECPISDNYVFIDDDDYYPPVYIENIVSVLQSMSETNIMIGNSRWIDYRLSTGYYRERIKYPPKDDCMSEWHSSAIKGEVLKQRMMEVLLNNPTTKYNDIVCFKALFNNNIFPCKLFDFKEWGAFSLKDYGCGTHGAISAHYSNNELIPDDNNFSFFKAYLDNDWKRYEKYLGRLRNAN